MTPKILVNATTLVVGGGVQVGTSFVQYASGNEGATLDFIFAVSGAIYENLPIDLQEDERVLRFDMSPSRILKGRRSRFLLQQLEQDFQPDIVYTLGLPSYTRFQSVEVGRYTNPWEINLTNLAWPLLPLRERIYTLLRTRYRLFWAGKATFFETQTEAAKAGIAKRFNVPADRIKVIPNSPNPIFFSPVHSPADREPPNDETTIFCLAAGYRHKNLTFIPEVAKHFKEREPANRLRFILTLPEESRVHTEIREASRRLGVADMIKNVGSLLLTDCVPWYEAADIVFLPTLLEVFSATYVEAMAMSKPIVTPDLDFARAVCGDAAMYYRPRLAAAAADAILLVKNDQDLRTDLVERGRIQLATFPDPASKHQMVIEWLGNIVQSLGHRSF